MRKNFKFFRGFTLVEILVALGIFSIVFFLGVASYREFNRRQQLVEGVKLVRQDLLLAQQKALSGEKKVCPTSSSNTLLGYVVSFSTNSYRVLADCLTGTDPVVKGPVALPIGITKTSGPETITFKILAQGTTDVTDSSIVLTQGSTGKTATISVTRSGSVSITLN